MKKPVRQTEKTRCGVRSRPNKSSTERKGEEDALRQSEKKYRELFHNAEVGIFRSKIDGSAILAANQKLCEIFGYTAEEFIENPAHIRWADAGARDRMLAALMKKRSLRNYEIDIRTKTGGVRTVSVSLHLYKDQGYLEGSAVDITERKHFEAALRESEAGFRQLAESVPQLIWTCRGDGPCDYLSPQWLEYTGIPEAEQLGFGWLSQLHPGDRDRTAAAWNAAVETNKPFDVEFRIRRKDYIYRWFKTRGVAIRDGEGRIVKWYGTSTDIEDQRQAEQALALQARIATIFLTVPDDEMFNEVLKVILDVMHSPFGVFGYLDEAGALVVPTMTRQIWDKCQVPEKTIRFPRETWGDSSWPRAIREKRTIYSNEPSANIPAGHVGIQRHISLPVVFHGEVIGLCQVANGETDYTEADRRMLADIARHVAPLLDARLRRERAQDALRASEARYRSYVDVTGQIAWVTSADGEIVEDVPSMRKFSGQTYEEAKGSGWAKTIHPDDLERTLRVWNRAVATKSNYEIEYRMRRHDGVYRHLLARGFPVFIEDGSIREWVGSCIDITERKQVEEEVRRLNLELEQRVQTRTTELQVANKELEAFTYSVSHDLRAPLRAVDGFSRILLDEHATHLPPEVQRYLNLVRSNTLQMAHLVDDLLMLSQLGRQSVIQKQVHLAELLREALDLLHNEQDGRQVKITVGDLPSCQGDRALLKQVFVNLLSNALKFTRLRDPAVIEVGSSRKDGENVYFIRDNGVGFDMRYVSKLFGVFQRLHRSEDYEGTGIGLAIVQRIVHRHGGRVWAEAETDKGATFYFTLGGIYS